MTRTYGNLEQSLILAKYYAGKGVKSTEVKAALEPSRYQVKLGGQVLNFDYKIIEAMLFAIESSVPVKPKRTVKAKASAIPAV